MTIWRVEFEAFPRWVQDILIMCADWRYNIVTDCYTWNP